MGGLGGGWGVGWLGKRFGGDCGVWGRLSGGWVVGW